MAGDGGRVSGHVAGVGVCHRESDLWHGWEHVAAVVAGLGGMWQGVGYVAGG